MRNPIWPLQVALKNKADEVAGVKFYDAVPESEPVNYVTMGEFKFDNRSDKSSGMMEVVHQFTAWSQYDGTKKICEMIDEILAAFDGFVPDLAASGFQVVFDRWDSGEIARYDRGGTIYRFGQISFRYKIEEV